MDSLIKKSFPDYLRIKPKPREEQKLSIKKKQVKLLPGELSEDDCYINRTPYMQHILLELEVNGKEYDVFLGDIPALTSRGTLLYGAIPVEQRKEDEENKVSTLLEGTTPLRERVACFQLLPPQNPKERALFFLAPKVQKAESDKERQKEVKKALKKPKQKAAIIELTVEKLVKMDTTCLDNYCFRGIGDYLGAAIRTALGRIRGYFRSFPLQSEDDLESLFFPSEGDSNG